MPEIYALCEAAGLRLVTFLAPALYAPPAPQLRPLWAGLDGPARAALAELMTGARRKHVFHVVHAANPVTPPDPNDSSLIPILRQLDPTTAAQRFAAGGHIRVGQGETALSLPVPPLAKASVRRVDGRRTIAEIGAEIRTLRPDLDAEGFMRQFVALYETLNGINEMLLSRRPIYPRSRK